MRHVQGVAEINKPELSRTGKNMPMFEVYKRKPKRENWF